LRAHLAQGLAITIITNSIIAILVIAVIFDAIGFLVARVLAIAIFIVIKLADTFIATNVTTQHDISLPDMLLTRTEIYSRGKQILIQ
jgi:hypothetical protein